MPDQIIAALIAEGVEPKFAKVLCDNKDSYIAYNHNKEKEGIDRAKLASLIANKKIDIGKDIPAQYQKLTQSGITDRQMLEKVVAQILAENPSVVADYKKGKANALQFLVGQANPQIISKLFLDLLSGS